MEYLAKKSFSFLQDFAFTSINNETYTNKWNISRKSRFIFCKILHLLVLTMKHVLINEYLAKKSFSFLQDFAFISKSILKNIYCFIYFSLVYFFAKNSFISTSKVFYKLCKYVNSRRKEILAV